MNASSLPYQLLVPEWPYQCESLVAVAQHHAVLMPQRRPFTFIDYSGPRPQDFSITYERLDRRARQIAARLQAQGDAGDRVLLLYPAGLDYLCALFGCLYAGMIAVPSYPPLNPRLRSRLAAVVEDCDAGTALTTRATLEQLGDQHHLLAPLRRLRWLATDTPLDTPETAWTPPTPQRERLAILQYTSGSTGTPKGVMLTHGNLLHNVYAMALHMQCKPGDRHFTWLPPYHDMGLIGTILGSFCAGVPLSFMAAAAFLRRPERWLTEISARRCTLSGAPNFAYELCIDKIADGRLQTLDLSCWALAYSGAEPIRADTLERFAARFGAAGFRRQAFYPCYGMAETTLFVAGKRHETSPLVLTIDTTSYGRGSCETVGEDVAAEAPQRQIVSCGVTVADLDVCVVDPKTSSALPDGRVGEIWVAGPSVAAGYWRRDAETAAAFGGRIAGRQHAYLRTGDLGFMHEGELFVSGRLKDLIILRGVNHYPQDIERTVDRCHDAIRAGCGTAFSVTVCNEEHLVFVQEIGPRDEARADEIFVAMRDAIYAEHGVLPYALVLIGNGAIPKTTSGKLARRPCRERFLTDGLPAVAQWIHPRFADASPSADTSRTTASAA
ncbi:fatty acyl-AMP ligase [Paraburkholderia sp. D15]|uniref:fatty acyl-AMP ligase n=1 Tax=Paraburkholderia sp. D15 TaxID=2880218 RepID=UPI00247A70CB|nr:fatty acyl-AMP ligase [Paraburkholderia sp. D15]WGS49840.1 fatty acyl-AMP ligase [Paraburkholderia sp. D15]